uniref:Methyltransferase FkbM domain-containing protein n=1 Tax=Oryza meridionalis TaxID=40149 RepID=A0A0E0D2U6_9ORYZ
MPAPPAASWRRHAASAAASSSTRKTLLLLLPVLLLLLLFVLSRAPDLTLSPAAASSRRLSAGVRPFDCYASQQASPVFASLVEGVPHPFFYSLADMGALPDHPHKNIARILKGKRFRKPDISETIQQLLGGKVGIGSRGVVVDVGANVGMASFAAAVMGFRVVAFEPVLENLQRICDGVYLNRVQDQVVVYHAAASDRVGNITMHKVIGRLDNSAISATGAKLAFKANEEIAVEVATIPLDEVILDAERVVLIKIDVQGWEYHVLRGASKLLSRRKGGAPYLIYEEDERLLQASNSSAREIRAFLSSVGYNHCTRHGTDAHCTKN